MKLRRTKKTVHFWGHPVIMLISIHDQHRYIVCLYLKQNIIAINQSNQQFWGVFLTEIKTVVNTPFLTCCMECRRGLAMRILSVYQSVCPSVKRVNCDKTEEKSVQTSTPYERSIRLV